MLRKFAECSGKFDPILDMEGVRGSIPLPPTTESVVQTDSGTEFLVPISWPILKAAAVLVR
jgi:hypothetical protein